MTSLPYNPHAVPGDPDYRPGPDWPPSLQEVASSRGESTEDELECSAMQRPARRPGAGVGHLRALRRRRGRRRPGRRSITWRLTTSSLLAN
jgi:hypothetical protein